MNTTVLALLLAVFVSACSTEPASTPACNAAAPAGTWTTGATGQAKTLALLSDRTFVEETTAGELRGTWSTDGGAITFVTSEGSQDAPKSYWVVGDDLVIDETTWNPICPAR